MSGYRSCNQYNTKASVKHTMVFTNAAKVKGDLSHQGLYNVVNHRSNKSDKSVDVQDCSVNPAILFDKCQATEVNHDTSSGKETKVQSSITKQENSEQIMLYDINGLDEDKFVHTVFFKTLCYAEQI